MKTRIIIGFCRETGGKLKQRIAEVLGWQSLFVSGKHDEIMGRVDQYMGRAGHHI